MIAIRGRQAQIALTGFCLILLLAWFCYRPALGGAFQLDDIANLGGLADVDDLPSAIDFVLAGTSGPSGRPVALATFAWQAESWDDGPAAFLFVNILIHLANAALLAGCLYLLARLGDVERERAVMVAVLAAGAWALMPLLATASLLIVQRMTTLSATFCLLGLAGYLRARQGIEARPRAALVGMSASLVVATLLATLCKESGALLPVFILVVEATVLERPTNVRYWRAWQAIFLLLPLVLLLAYLASRVAYPDWIVARRGLNAWERVLTEARILWMYVGKALVGATGRLGIYQDAPAISRSLLEPVTLLAGAGWLVLGIAGIAWRRRYPLAALAVLWYLAGHLLESTVIPLELYFEHRNYLSVVGALYALASFVTLGQPRRRQIAAAAVTLYLAMSAYFLYSFASLWGEPSLASRYWALRYPDSVRAVTTMARYQLAEEGPLRALQTIDRFVIDHPEHAYLRLQELNLLCLVATDQDHSQVLEQLERRLPDVDFTYTAGAMLSDLFSTSLKTDCSGVDPATVARLAGRLHGNPRYVDDPLYNQFHYKLLAGIARQRGDHAATIGNLRQAIAKRPSSELNMMMVTALADAGDFDAARKFIDDARLQGPANPWRALQWRRDLDDLQAYVTALEDSKS